MSKFDTLSPRVMAELMSQFGLDEMSAAAIMGNAGHESAGLEQLQEQRPTVRGSAGGYGWFQWTGPRRRAFEAWAHQNNFDPASDQANLGFLVYELHSSETKSIDAVKAASGLDAKVRAFEKAYERAGVKAYPSRLKWAQRALDAYAATAGKPIDKPIHDGPVAPHTPPPTTTSWIVRLLTALGIIKPAPAEATSADMAGATTMRVQRQLQALGYPEVGMADGLTGPKLRAAIVAFCREQNPPIKSDGYINDEFLAALPKAHPRVVSQARANATASDLRQAGNQPLQGLHSLGWLGNALGLGGILGGIDQTGIFDSIKNTADSAASTFSAIQNALVAVINVVQWCVHHWWLFAVVAGLWMVYRVAMAVMNMVVLFRTGILQRPSTGAH